MLRCDGQYAEEAFGSGSSRREGRTRFFLLQKFIQIWKQIFQPRADLLKLQCNVLCRGEREQVPGEKKKWKKNNIFLPQNLQNDRCRWTRWSPPGRWSPSTLRPRGCPTSSMSTGPTHFTDFSSIKISKHFVTCQQQTVTGVSPLWRWSPLMEVYEVPPALSRFYIC